STTLIANGNDEQKDAVLQALDGAFCHWGCGAYVVDRPARRIGRVLGPMPTEADRHAILAAAGRALGKKNDPRYVPGVSGHDDDMTDEEWFWAMGPIPQDWQNVRKIAEHAALDVLARFDLEPEPGERPLAAYAEQL